MVRFFKGLLLVESLLAFGLVSTAVLASPRANTSQSTSNSCGGASGSNATAVSRSGNAGVGGRHSVGTGVSICVNGIQVGTSTSISVDQYGSSTAATSTTADCLNSRKYVRQGAYSGVRGGWGSAAAASSASCD